MKSNIEYYNNINQDFLDKYFGYQQKSVPEKNNLTPKGIDPLTLNKIKKIIANKKDGITAEEMAESVGVSRTTARRYLEYLISNSTLRAELKYGTVGRPQRKYYLEESDSK